MSGSPAVIGLVPHGAGSTALPSEQERRYALRRKLRAHFPGKPQVWLARDRRLDCEVVLKKFVGIELTRDWENEARLLARGLPQHPRLFDAFVDSAGCAILVREYLPGQSMAGAASALGNGRAAAAAILRLGGQAARLAELLHGARPEGCGLGPVHADDFILAEQATGSAVGEMRVLPNREACAASAGSVDARADIGILAVMVAGLLWAHAGLTSLPGSAAGLLDGAGGNAPAVRPARAAWLAKMLEDAAAEVEASGAEWARQSLGIAAPVARIEARLAVPEETLAGRRLGAGQLLGDAALARAAFELRESISIGEDAGRLIGLDTVVCERYPHQIETLRRVVARPEMSGGAILSDEVGLGKTIEALLICQELRARGLANSVLIVAPPSGAAQWMQECARRIRREAGEPAFHLCQDVRDLRRSLLIVSSAALRKERFLTEAIEARSDDLVIVDEAHRCCGGEGLSGLGAAVARLRRKRLLLLTATPINDHPGELAALASLIQPGVLEEALDGLGRNAALKPERMRAARTRIQAVMVRHRREDLDASIPRPELSARRIAVGDSACPEARALAAAGLICGEWRSERVVAFCRSAAIRRALAAAVRRQMPERAVIEFHGGRRDQRAQEAAFAERADAVMIAGDTVAEGMNWQCARLLAHLDVPLSPIVWEQRVGRIVRLGQRARRLEIAHFEMGEGDRQALDLYEHALGLFTLSVGEASSVLDHAQESAARGLERPIRAMLSAAGLNAKRRELLAEQLRQARAAYERQKVENRLLDTIYFDDAEPSAVELDTLRLDSCRERAELERRVQTVLDGLGAERRELKAGSGVWAARLGGEPILYTFDPMRGEEGSRLQRAARGSSLVDRAGALALARCAAVEAHYEGSSDWAGEYEPYLAAGFAALMSGAQASEKIEWLAVSLESGRKKRLREHPLASDTARGGRPNKIRADILAMVTPGALIGALRAMTVRFNADAHAAAQKQRELSQVMLERSSASVCLDGKATVAMRREALARLEAQAAVIVETSLLAAALLWVPKIPAHRQRVNTPLL